MRKSLATAAIGGGLGGLADMVYAIIVWGVILSPNWMAIPQSVASGLLGKSAFGGGWSTFLLGLALHFLIAFLMALAFVLASRRMAVLTRAPLLSGVIYGVVLFGVMNYLVVPLSAAPPRPWPHGLGLVRALAPHVLFVGPAIAYVTARRAPRAV